MCTVTYYAKSEGYILCSNRDEKVNRSVAIQPEFKTIANQKVILPIDGKAFGSWIFSTEKGDTFCLLNGADQKHVRKSSYRKSRGLILLEYFEYTTIQEFSQNINLIDIEPFTLVMMNASNELYTLVWDGSNKKFTQLDGRKNHIWSSSTLYSDEIKLYRKKLFYDLEFNSTADVLNFHQLGMNEILNDNSIFLKRENVQTVSTTLVDFSKEKHIMEYKDYLTDKVENQKINMIFELDSKTSNL